MSDMDQPPIVHSTKADALEAIRRSLGVEADAYDLDAILKSAYVWVEANTWRGNHMIARDGWTLCLWNDGYWDAVEAACLLPDRSG